MLNSLLVQWPLASIFSLNGHPRYIHAGWFLISVANFVVILLMIVAFAVAIAVPFPRGKKLQ